MARRNYEDTLEYNRLYREKFREQINQYLKRYDVARKETRKTYREHRYSLPYIRDEIIRKQKLYYINNRQYCLDWGKIYRETHKEKYKESYTKYNRKLALRKKIFGMFNK